MADVTGTIGNEYVELNNAATEATLKQLLAAVQAQGGKGAATNAANLAAAAGLPAATQAAAGGLKAVGTNATNSSGVIGKLGQASGSAAAGLTKVAGSIAPFLDKLLAGTATVSDFTAPLSKLPGMFGALGTLITKVMQYQEENVKTYREITSAGVNFGGSLTSLRQAALNSYLTLDQFSNLIKNNSEAFSRMGANSNDGAKAFASFTNQLISSDVGSGLMALGYSTEQINNTMAQYIAATGGRTRQELMDRDALTKSAKAYFEQLDALATITGQTREEQEQGRKEAAQQAAFQRKLASLGEEERLNLQAAYDKAYASKIAGATDLVMAEALGLPAVTKAGQTLSGVAPAFAESMRTMTQLAMRTGTSMGDIDREFQRGRLAAAEQANALSQTGDALSLIGGETGNVISSLIRTQNQLNNQGVKTEADAAAQAEAVRLEQEKRQKESQARQMADAEKAVKEMGQAFNSNLTPAVNLVTSGITKLTTTTGDAVKWFDGLSTEMKALGVAGAAVTAWLLKDLAVKRAGEMLGGGGLGGLRGPLGSARNPMYVIVMNGGGVGLPGGGPGGPQRPAPPPGGPRKPAPRRGGGGRAGLLGLGLSFGLDQASDFFGGTDTTTGSVLDSASSIAGWAGTGAMLGSVIPGIGTAAGAIAGGGAAALYELYSKIFAGPKMANGGVVTRPTTIMAGEAGSEAIIPLHHLESLNSELKTLNSQSAEILRYMKETAEHTRQTVDATKSLNGDLFKF